MALFSLSDVLAMELDVMSTIPAFKSPKNIYFKEEVAKYLYREWLADNSDARIIMYAMPMIQSLMVRQRNLIKKYERMEVFNILCLDLLDTLPKYNPNSGRLYTFCTLNVSYRLLDFNKTAYTNKKRLEEGKIVYEEHQFSDGLGLSAFEIDGDFLEPMTSDDYINAFSDFITFLDGQKSKSGKTARRILDAILYVLTSEQAMASQGQAKIIERVCVKCQLPDVVVKRYYNRLLSEYLKNYSL